jgi:hypothetical protein
MHLPDGEPEAGPWRTVPVSRLLEVVLTTAGQPSRERPRIVAIDGRAASGKSTLATAIQRQTEHSAVIHTDDLAWHEPLFGWGHLLADHVLAPLHAGRPLAFRPPQWEARGREGAIEVPAGTGLVLIEGTGASQLDHADLLDATVWVQADVTVAEQRGLARDIASGVNGGPDEAIAFWDAWLSEELPFLDRHRPWERADVVVNGTPGAELAPDHVEVSGRPSPGVAPRSPSRKGSSHGQATDADRR